MAKRNLAEVAVGAVVIVLAAGFLGYAVAHSGRSSAAGYPMHAEFERIDGLTIGADVRLAGVKVGRVTETSIDPKTYQAMVTMTVADNIALPRDTSAAVSSDGLLGGKYINLVPGGDEQMLPRGGRITVTQSAVNIEDLLGRFIFSATNLSGAAAGAGAHPPAGATADGAKP